MRSFEGCRVRKHYIREQLSVLAKNSVKLDNCMYGKEPLGEKKMKEDFTERE